MNVSLYLSINDTLYLLTPCNGETVKRGWSLMKCDGTVYHVYLDKHGLSCDCFDGIKKTNEAKKCKHARSIQQMGLI